MAFAEAYEQRFHPICTIPVESDSVRGLLWVQDGGTYGTSDNRSLSVYVRGMLLDDDARDLLPHWAGFISGVIESPSLTPTASREDLQRDEHYRAAQNAIAEALISGLANIAAHEPEAWRRVLTRHNEALLGASLCDDRLFSLLANAVRLPTSRGELPAASLRVKGEVHLALQAESGFEAMLFRALQVPVAHGDRYGVAAFLRRWCHQFNAKLIEIGTASGDGSVFQPATLKDDEIDWLAQALGDGEKVIPVRFRPAELPFVVIIDREARLKHLLESDEADRRISSAALRLIRAHTAKVDGSHTARLYVNLDNPSMRALLDARAAQPQGAARAAALLKAFKHITLASDETLKDGQSAQALRVIGESAIALLDAH
jgi:molecular chaperone HtpG